jgi:fibronectin-binding autotransporter adhesin
MAKITWKYNTDGLWSNAGNWNGGVLPGAADDVTLATASTHTITFSSISATIHSLTATTDSLALTSGTLSILTTANFQRNLSVDGGTFAVLGTAATIGGTFTGVNSEILLATGAQWKASDTVFGSSSYGNNGSAIDGGTLSTSGTVNIFSGYNYGLLLGGGAVWNNSATVTDNGLIETGDGFGLTATINNSASGTFDLSTGGGVTNGSARGPQGQTLAGSSIFDNAGTVALTSGTGTAHIYSAFSNTGLISATTGTLEFDGGGTFGGTLSGAGQIAFGGGTVTLSAGPNPSIAGLLLDGAVVTPTAPLNYTGTLALTAGSLALAAGTNSFANFSQYGGNNPALRMGTATSLALNNADLGSGIMDGGTLTTAGTTTLAGYNGYYYYMGNGLSWTNTGAVNQNYYFAVDTAYGAAYTIANQAGASWNMTGDGYWLGGNSTVSGPGLAIFNNAGTYAKTGGTATNQCYAQFNNTGTINAATGTLEFDNGGTIGGTLTGAGTVAFGSGSFTFASAISVQVTTLYLDGGNVTLNGSLTPAGNLVVGSGSINLNGGMLKTANASLYGGTIDGPGTLALSGITQLGNSNFYFGGNAAISNAGTILQNGYVYVSYQSGAGYTLTNSAGAVYDILGNYTFGYNNSNGTSSSLINAGTFAKAGGTGLSQVASTLTNTGIITSNAGILEFDGGGTVGGALSGTGTVAFGGGNFAFGSTLAAKVSTLYIDGASITLSGNLSPAGSLVFGSGSLLLNGNTLSTKNANLSSGTIDGAGTLSLSGTTQLGAGSFNFGGNAAISNTGTILDNGTVYVSYQSGAAFALTNSAGADFQFTTNASIGYNNGTGLNSTIANAGTFAATGGTSTSTVYSVFTNTGAITANAGLLDFVGGGVFGGTLTGTSAIDFGGGAATFASGLSSSVATLYVAGATVTLAENFSTGSSQFTLTSQVDLAGFTLTTANANLGASTIVGPGTVTTTGTTQIAGYQGNGYADYFGGGMVLNNTGTVNNSYYLYVVNQAGVSAFTINNESGATWNVTGDFQIGGNQAPGETSVFNNAGTFAKTGGSNYTTVTSYFTNTGTIISNNAAGIEFNGGGVFGGSITGTDNVSFNNNNFTWAHLTAGATTLETMYYSGFDVTAASSVGQLNTYSSSLTLAAGTTLTVSGTLGILQAGGGLPLDGPGTLLTTGGVNIIDWYNNGVMFSVGGGSTWENSGGTVTAGGILQIGDNQAQYGSVAGTVINTSTGVYDLTTNDSAIFEGSYVNSFGQTLSSGGLFSNAGLFEKTGGTATSYVYADFISTGTIATSSGTIGFDAGGTFSGLIADGSNVVFAAGAFTQNTLKIGGGAGVLNNAAVTLLGALTIGDTSTLAATLTNAGTFDIASNFGIVRSGTAKDGLVNTGLFAKTAGTGRSLVNVAVTNSGTIVAGSGTLAFTGGIAGTGVLEIGPGATLELGSGVATTQGVTFASDTGTLLLDTPTAFGGTVSGLTVGDVFELAGITATTATVNGSDQLVISNGTTVVADINLSGSYLSDTFTVGSNGSGSALITLSAAATAWKGTNSDWYATNVWTNAPPNAQTNAVVSLAGTYTLSLAGNETAYAKLLTLAAPSATYALNGVLNLTTGLTLTAGDLQLGGTINGGTISNKGGSFTFGGATLNNVVYNGPIDLSETNASLLVTGSFALNGATGTGASSIALTGSNAFLSFAGDETLSNATVSIGNASGTDYLQAYDPTAAGAILTLASSLTVTQTGLHAVIDDSGHAFDAVYNSGKVIASLSGGTFTVLGNDFENDGTVTVSNGDTFNIDSTQFVNAGTLSVSGATLGITASYQNTGSVTATNSVLNLGTTLTGAQLNAVALGGDTLNLSGTLALGGATLGVGPTSKIVAASLSGNINGGTVNATGTGFTFLNGSSLANVTYNGTMTVGGGVAVSLAGTIANAVIADAGNGILFTPQTVLKHVKYDGTVTLQAGNSVGILSGLTLAGTGGTGQGAISAVAGASLATLYALDSESLSNVQISSGAGSAGTLGLELDAAGALNTSLVLASTATLTVLANTVAGIDSIGVTSGVALGNKVLSSGDIVLQAGAQLKVDSSVSTFTNAGSISLAAGAVATIGAVFVETGKVAVSAGGTFDVNGTTTLAALAGVGGAGTLGINGTLALGGGNFDMAASGRISNVEIGGTLQGGTFTNDAGAVTFGSLATLSSMTWKGALAIGTGTTVDVLNSLTVETIAGGLPGTIELIGGASAGASLIYAGGVTLNNATLSSSGSAGLGTPSLQDALGLSAAGTITLGSAFTLAVASGATTLLDTGGAGAIVNDGAVDVNGGQLWIDGSIASFTNASVMNFAADTALGPAPTGTGITNFSNTGTVNLVSLDNFDWSGSGSNAGLLAIGAGSEASFGGNFANAGTVTMGQGGSLTATGTMTNGGQISASGATSDFVTAADGAGSAFNAGTLTGGTWAVGANSMLTLNAAMLVTADAATITLAGSGAVLRSVGSSIQRLESTLKTITAGGALNVLGSRGYVTTLGLLDSGTLQLGGGTFSAASLAVAAGGKFLGFGTVTNAIANAGTLQASGGTLSLQGAVTGTGGLQIAASAELVLGAANAETVTFSGAAAELALTSPTSFTGTLSGFAASDSILLGSTTATQAVLSGSTLTVTLSGGATETFKVAGNSATVTLTVSASGGNSLLTYPGAKAKAAMRFLGSAAHAPPPASLAAEATASAHDFTAAALLPATHATSAPVTEAVRPDLLAGLFEHGDTPAAGALHGAILYLGRA